MAPRSGRGASRPLSVADLNRVVRTVSRLARIVNENTRAIDRIINADTNAMDDMRDEQHVQFKRLAQLQAELDTIKNAWEKMRGRD